MTDLYDTFETGKRLSDANQGAWFRPIFTLPIVPVSFQFSLFAVTLGPILRRGNHLGELESGWKERLTWNDGYLESSVWRGSFDDCGRAQNKWLFNGNPRALDSACLDPQWQSAFHGQSRAGKCERTKQMTFQWQSRASQTLMLPTSWQGKAKMHWSMLHCTALCVMHKSTVHSNSFGSGSVLVMHWAL